MLVLCDLDGTLACLKYRITRAGAPPSREDRKAFTEWLERLQVPDDMLQDKVILHVAAIVEMIVKHYNDTHLVYLTSREEKYRDVTREWMRKHDLPDGPLYMRTEGDWRSSAEYKGEVIEGLVRLYGKAGIAIDDDYDGDCSAIYLKHGFLHLKVIS